MCVCVCVVIKINSVAQYKLFIINLKYNLNIQKLFTRKNNIFINEDVYIHINVVKLGL